MDKPAKGGRTTRRWPRLPRTRATAAAAGRGTGLRKARLLRSEHDGLAPHHAVCLTPCLAASSVLAGRPRPVTPKACDPLRPEDTRSPREKVVSGTGTRGCAAAGSAPTRALGGVGPRTRPGTHVHMAGTVTSGRTAKRGPARASERGRHAPRGSRLPRTLCLLLQGTLTEEVVFVARQSSARL